MVQGFINQSKGAITVHSAVGVGTTFKLYFPVAKSEKANPEETGIGTQRTSGPAMNILVAEDEVAVANILKKSLEAAGHSVLVAESGDAALEIHKTTPECDILLTDVVMPGSLQGPALALSCRRSVD